MHRKTLRLLLVAIVCAVLPVWGEEAKPAAQSIDISKTTCKELMAGDDIDRDTGMAYFHGFLAGKQNNSVINVQAMTELTDKVKDFCLSNPTSTVMEAFQKSAK